MKHINAMFAASLALMVAAGCSAGDPGESIETGDVPAEAEQVSEGLELARVEFEDGNVVRFEELDGGVLVTESGSDLNVRHLTPKDGMTALEAFKTLAPDRAIPAALNQMHTRLHPEGATHVAPQSESETPAEQDVPADPDLEHNGEFQAGYPAASFLQTMCDFPLTAPSYKHTNRTDPHTDVSLNIHNAYFAVGADVGIVTAQPCAGQSDSKGFFTGKCGSAVSVNPGFANSGLYDAGDSCSKSCTLLFGCVTICHPKQVRFELRYNKISSSVRFHECAKLAH
jgi:hypothetical protein